MTNDALVVADSAVHVAREKSLGRVPTASLYQMLKQTVSCNGEPKRDSLL